MRLVTELGLGEEPVVGETYLVPCMDITELKYGPEYNHTFLENQPKMKHVPVIGTVHSDAELPGSGGEKEHIHVDTRFMAPEHMKAWDIIESQFDAKSGWGPTIPIIPHIPTGYPETHLHPMVCYRVTPDHAETRLAGDHYAILEAEMEKHTLKLDKPICPHQGTPLGGIKPKDGIIHCPLHGLGFCSKTGKLVRKTKAFTDKYGFGPSPWNSAEPVEEKERQASCH